MKGERDAVRIDADDTFALHIFRNRYERKSPAFMPWITQHPKRLLEDDPDGIEILKIVNERFGNP